MRFLPRHLHRTTGSPARATRNGAVGPGSRATVHALCDARNEAKVRALCVLGLKPGIHLLGLRTSQDHDSAVHVWVTLAVEGPAVVLLEQLITRLSAESDVRDLHWRLHGAQAPQLSREAVA
ncbi:hypothetical protein ACPCTO_09730 [Streptomyces olivoreticuli]